MQLLQIKRNETPWLTGTQTVSQLFGLTISQSRLCDVSFRAWLVKIYATERTCPEFHQLVD